MNSQYLDLIMLNSTFITSVERKNSPSSEGGKAQDASEHIS